MEDRRRRNALAAAGEVRVHRRRAGDLPEGFDLYLIRGGEVETEDAATVGLPEELHYLSGGDVVTISTDGQRLRVLWRHQSRQNSILLTERCNHYCLMCSQPPKTAIDDHLLAQAFEMVRLLPRDVPEIGFTGGEPTIYGEELIGLLRLVGNLHPEAQVHVLSNGTRFADPRFAASWGALENPNLMVGIPIYGAEPARHDYVVQSKGASTDGNVDPASTGSAYCWPEPSLGFVVAPISGRPNLSRYSRSMTIPWGGP